MRGRKSRDFLSSLTPDDLTNAGFPFGASQETTLGSITTRATRISYMGELGWELYVPTEWAVALFDLLVQAGEPHGMKLCGMHAMDSLRIDKAYRHWGHDISPDDNPIEAGLAFAVAFDNKIPFIGRDALLQQKAEPVLKKRLLQFLLTDPEPMMYHNEAIFRDGVQVGTTTSAAYGHHLGGAVALGYVVDQAGVTADYVASGTWEIEIGLKRYPARASLRPLPDPTSARMKVRSCAD